MKSFFVISTATGLALVLALAAPAANALPLTLVSHTATASTDAEVTGYAADPDSDSATGTDPTLSSHSLSFSGAGSLHSLASSSAKSNLTSSATQNIVKLENLSYYSASLPGGTNPGGTAESDITATWVFSLDALSVDLIYNNSFSDLGGHFSGSSTLSVKNITAGGPDILSLVDPGSIGSTTLNFTGLVGDLIKIEFSGSSSGSAPPGASYSIYRDRFTLRFETIVGPPSSEAPEPAAILLLGDPL